MIRDEYSGAEVAAALSRYGLLRRSYRRRFGPRCPACRTPGDDAMCAGCLARRKRRAERATAMRQFLKLMALLGAR